jgi:hypothetical protein
MPYTVTGDPSSWKDDIYNKESFDYDYPYGLDLRPESDLHTSLRNNIWQRARESRNEISKRFDSWREIDRTLTAYIPLKDKEEALQKKDETKPVSIVFPYTYSTLEALLTYLTMAFFQDPIFQYEGVEADDKIGAMLLELVIKLQCIKNKVPLNIHTLLRDGLSYGVGIAIPEWDVRYGMKRFKTSVITQSELGEQTENDFVMQKGVIFEGNALSNIEPYMWLPDPSVSSTEIQRGEFVGWVDRDNYMNLLSEENNLRSLFNVKYLRSKGNKRSAFSLDESDRTKKHGGSTETHRSSTNATNPVDVIKMYVNLIPKEWKLGTGEYPEKWYFELAADDVIIACERVEHYHDLYPISTVSPEYDGYSISPMGRLEILYGLQHTLDFLFNSHVSNVKKAINDMFVVDPYLVNINDMRDPKEGKLIRLRRPAWGRGVDKVVQQLGVVDITRNNVADAGWITSLMDRIAGADQSMQGALRRGGPERLTGAEFQGTRGSAISRLQRIAMIIGTQCMQDIGEMFAAHAQEYMNENAYVKVVGRYEQQLLSMFGKDRVPVTPNDIQVNYDLIVRDGSIPGGNFSQHWIDIFKIVGTSDQLLQQFDIVRMFTYIATQLGANNVEDFRRKTDQVNATTMPDEAVAREAEKGNLVPIGEV